MIHAYAQLNQLGHAHSIECWQNDELVGGLYGVQVGLMFCGESMFSRQADASKIALHALCQQGFAIIDCQLPTDHLLSMGATVVHREDYLNAVAMCASKAHQPKWQIPIKA